MPKRKALKSVARSVADSFTSNMNYWGNDYVMGHILNAARASGESVLEVDLVTGGATPSCLLIDPVAQSVRKYVEDFPDLVRRSGSDPTQ